MNTEIETPSLKEFMQSGTTIKYLIFSVLATFASAQFFFTHVQALGGVSLLPAASLGITLYIGLKKRSVSVLALGSFTSLIMVITLPMATDMFISAPIGN